MGTKVVTLVTIAFASLSIPSLARADLISSGQAGCMSRQENEGCITPDGRPGRCLYPPGVSAGDRDPMGRPMRTECRVISAGDTVAVRNADAAPAVEAPAVSPTVVVARSQRPASPPPSSSGGCTTHPGSDSTGSLIVCVALGAALTAASRRPRRAQ
jgi:hypothetical protein